MSKFNFRNVGVRMLESEAGDIMICDSNLNFDTIIVAEILELAKKDDRLAATLGRQIVNFVVKQREARFKIASQKIGIIERLDRAKASLLANYLSEGNLRKAEKDIFFFFEQHPDAEEGIEVEMLPKHD